MQFIAPERIDNMKLKEEVFQNHMEVELRSGIKCIVVAKDLYDACEGDYVGDLRDFNDDLTYTISIDNDGDIMKVTNPFTKEVVFERVDWSKVEVDTKILVEDITGNWINRYFAKYEDEKIYAWQGGKTSWTTDLINHWENVKLYKEEGNQ